MRKDKHYKLIEDDAQIDFRLEIENGKVVHFSINLSIITDKGNIDIYRVDTAHQGLHEQKFWISPKPKYIEKRRKENYDSDYSQKKKEVLENFEKWVKLYKNKFLGEVL